MKNRVLFLVLFLIGLSASAQQDPQFTQWMFDKVSFNPAAAGIDRVHCFTLFHRDQWDMLDRDPKTYMFNYDGMFTDLLPNVGVGLTFYTDALGQEKTNVFRVSGNYQYAIPGVGVLSGGLAVGNYSKVLGDDWRPIDVDDPTILELPRQSSSVLDFSLGAMFKGSNYYGGISTTHLSQGELSNLNINVLRTYWLMGGYDYTVPTNHNFVFRSNVLAKTDFNALQYDININMLYANTFWLGASYRGKDAVAPMAGYIYTFAPVKKETSQFESKIMFGLSYDAGLSDLKNYNDGSYELFVKYCFNFSKVVLRRPYSNPRFLGHRKIN